MSTYANVDITDDQGGTAHVIVASDGHRFGEILIDCAESWKNRVNDDDPEPGPGTAVEFADTLCSGYWGRKHNGEVMGYASSQEFQYTVRLTGGRVATIAAERRQFDHDAYMRAMRSGRDPLTTGLYRPRWTVTFPPPAEVAGA